MIQSKSNQFVALDTQSLRNKISEAVEENQLKPEQRDTINAYLSHESRDSISLDDVYGVTLEDGQIDYANEQRGFFELLGEGPSPRKLGAHEVINFLEGLQQTEFDALRASIHQGAQAEFASAI